MSQSEPHKPEQPFGSYKYDFRFLLLSVIGLLAAAVYFTLTHYYLNQNFPLAKLEALINGTAYKPFQFRILIPWMVGAINSVTGVGVLLLYQIIESASVIGLIFSTRYFLRNYFTPPLVDIFSFGVLLLLPWNYLLPREIALVIPADIPAVMFFTLLLGLMVRKNWLWYYILFAVATVNRETTCFVGVIFLMTHWKKLSHKNLLLHLGAQIIIWAAIKTWLAIIYAGNPGVLFEFYNVGSGRSHFMTNLDFLLSPKRVLILLSSFGFLWIPVIIWRKFITEDFVKRALWSLVFFFAVMLVIGNLNEARIFGEWIPLILAANLIIIRELSFKFRTD